MPKITLEGLQTFIEEVQKQIITSNNVANRTEHPYYYSHPSIPEQLISFKEKLFNYRSLSSDLITILHDLSVYKTRLPSYADFNNLSRGSFFHGVVGNLVVSSFGIGECSECSTLLAIKLANAGFGDLAFVSLHFTNAKPGMEIGHQFIITNLSKMPMFPSNTKITAETLFTNLPEDAYIGDPLLGLCFSPRNVPEIYNRYIHAYGGKTEVVNFRHLFNLTERTFGRYLSVANDVKAILQRQNILPTLGVFSSPESWIKRENSLPEQKENKVSYKDRKNECIITLPIRSEKARKYVGDLNDVLGVSFSGRIVQRNVPGTCVSFPSFWLKQLGKQAIQQLANNLEIKPKQLSAVISSVKGVSYRPAIVHPGSSFFMAQNTEKKAAISVPVHSAIIHPASLELNKL